MGRKLSQSPACERLPPDYSHWHGTYEVAERLYKELVPQAREIVHQAETSGDPQKAEAAQKVHDLIEQILSREEHTWLERETK